ncbi:hypothetical protein [Absicoccus porci]|jgi:hypothetical protein|uniref:hypothetical protein n=1 Tax=Absicoccus porci TaxID=2486576 RepID=UPI0023541B91|nr:hypothetical protein [Absicoccus porci]MCI6087226.1 hypothetical protein [Absicoccus porci]MDD6459975.1 hypothetical protein [Absicoccus porci]MEE1355623.1 hypothetical protein [Absicoccus porci]
MTREQKALFQQLQLTGLGLVIGLVGFFLNHDEMVWIGLAVLAYGLVRTWFIAKIIQKAKDE